MTIDRRRPPLLRGRIAATGASLPLAFLITWLLSIVTGKQNLPDEIVVSTGAVVGSLITGVAVVYNDVIAICKAKYRAKSEPPPAA